MSSISRSPGGASQASTSFGTIRKWVLGGDGQECRQFIVKISSAVAIYKLGCVTCFNWTLVCAQWAAFIAGRCARARFVCQGDRLICDQSICAQCSEYSSPRKLSAQRQRRCIIDNNIAHNKRKKRHKNPQCNGSDAMDFMFEACSLQLGATCSPNYSRLRYD